MIWQYCFGFSDNETTKEFDITKGCAYTFGAFVIMPVGIIYFTFFFFPGLVQECLENSHIGVLVFSVFLLIGFWIGNFYLLKYSSWYFSKFRFDEEGVHLRTLFRAQRTIKWSDIQKAAVYDVYWGRTYIGIPFILMFLDLDKRPIELYGDNDGFRRRRHFVMIYASKANIKAFESFWGVPLEKGVQKGPVYGLETHPFEEQSDEES